MAARKAAILALSIVLAVPAEAETFAGASLEGIEVPVFAARELRPTARDFAFFWAGSAEGVLVSLRVPAGGLPGVRTRVLLPKPVLVYTWGPEESCPACPAAMSLMERAHERYSEDGLRVVGLGLKAGREQLSDAAGRYGHLIGGGSGETAAALELKDLTHWILIDGQGARVATSPRATEEALFPWLEHLLRGGSAPQIPPAVPAVPPAPELQPAAPIVPATPKSPVDHSQHRKQHH